MGKPGFVYMMASRRNGTIYIGVTSNLPARAYQHRNGMIEGPPKSTAASSSSGTRRMTTWRTLDYASFS